MGRNFSLLTFATNILSLTGQANHSKITLKTGRIMKEVYCRQSSDHFSQGAVQPCTVLVCGVPPPPDNAITLLSYSHPQRPAFCKNIFTNAFGFVALPEHQYGIFDINADDISVTA